MGLVRLVVFGFIGLTIVYVSVWLYTRSVRRENLEKEYDADPVEGMTRDDYVEKGMVVYNNSLRPKLLLLVYVVPVVAFGLIVYLTNNYN